VIETGAASSRVALTAGPRIELASNSRARILRDRLVLEAGAGDLSSPGRFEIEAGAFRIAPASPDSTARVARAGGNEVQVAALKGSLRVYGTGGLLIANVVPGTALAFEPQGGGAAPPSNFLGCLLKKEGKFVLFDQATRILVELRGSGFEHEWGNRVQVIGTTDANARSTVAAQVVDVSSVSRFGVGGCRPVAQAVGAEVPEGAVPSQPAPPPAAGPQPVPPAGSVKTGMSAGVKVAIIAAVGGGGAAAAVIATKSDTDRSND
jgi:hypothetical protein